MPESPVRVALLARAGDAREQLRRALVELGADVVAEGDPSELDPGTVAGRQPAVVVVSLEPAIEDALAEFEDLLAMPGVQVIYDDAEVTGKLAGWDLARWARHLASKLAGTEGVLPPAPGGGDDVPEASLSLEPGAPPTPAQEMDHHRLEDYAAESLDLSEWVPSTPSLTEVDVADSSAVADAEDRADVPGEPDMDLDLDLDIDLAGLEEAMSPSVEPEAVAAEGLPAGEVDTLDFDGADAGDFVDLNEFGALDLGDLDAIQLSTDPVPGDDADLELAAGESPGTAEPPRLVDLELSDEPVRFSSFSDDDDRTIEGMDDDVAALAAQLDAFEASDVREAPREPDFASSPGVEDRRAPAAAPEPEAAPRAASTGFGSLELVPMDAESQIKPADEALPPPLPARENRSGKLQLADSEAMDNNQTAVGAVLVFAGLGGPDGVRQLLSALPPTLPVPLLLYQHLDTGKHERLVTQLAKASRLPLDLATEGKLAFAGRVAVLQPGTGVVRQGVNFLFVGGGNLTSVVATLPPADSVVLVLSGGDPTVVPAVIALQAAGAQVLVQEPSSCFDATAPQALVAAGATTGTMPELARLIIERWS